jgi:hypothetical protein
MRRTEPTGGGKGRIAFAAVVVEATGRCPDVPIALAQPGSPAIEYFNRRDDGSDSVTGGATLTTVLHAVTAAR